jgi:hypothetical protein
MYAAAPVSNPDGLSGITVHIDAGAALSRNLTSDLQGGHALVDPTTGRHIDLLYFGLDQSVTVPSVVATSFDTLKQLGFAQEDEDAREIAFHYVIFGDKRFNPVEPNSSGVAEIGFYDHRNPASNQASISGNDLIVTLSGRRDKIGFLQGQTLAHELGHNLGLRHSGTDRKASINFPSYRSLMNYTYQFDEDANGNLVRDYSGPQDAVFDDWGHINLDFADSLVFLGNSFGQDGSGAPFDIDSDQPDLIAQLPALEAAIGPITSTPAVLTILAPSQGSSVVTGRRLAVSVAVSDDRPFTRFTVALDLDGDGTIDEPGETVAATRVGPGSYVALFDTLTGVDGTRTIQVSADDQLGYSARAAADVTVTAAAAAGPPETINPRSSLS